MECPKCFFAPGGKVDDDKLCSSCGRSYRPGVNVYLGLVALVYLAFVRYVFYILTGNLFSFQPRPSWWVFDWARYPVDILYRPEYIFILGAFLALLIFVPVVIALLYGKRGGFLLAAIALLLGPNWILGSVLMISIWIAGGATLRLSSKVGAALLACLPAWVFCLLASRPADNVLMAPAYYVPAVVAILLDVLLVFLLLVPLGWLKWRARVAGIVLSLLCVLPIGAYQKWIGADEIQYALMTGPQRYYFVNISGADVIKQLQADARKLEDEERAKETKAAKEKGGLAGAKLNLPGLPVEDLDSEARRQAKMVNAKIQFEFGLRNILHDQKVKVVREGLDFLNRYPKCRRTPDVLFAMAKALDMDVDTTALRDAQATNIPIVYSWSRMRIGESMDILQEVAKTLPKTAPPCPYKSSLDLWNELLTKYSGTPYTVAAQVKLADYDARQQGNFAKALAAYQQILQAYRAETDKPLPDLSNLSVFTNLLNAGRQLQARKRAELIDGQYRIAQRENELLAENLDCPKCHNEVLKAFLQIPMFETPDARREKLLELRKKCPNCKLADNIAFELAMLEPRLTSDGGSATTPAAGRPTPASSGEGRMEMLLKVARTYPGTDGAAQALFTLAELETNIAGPAGNNRTQHLNRAIDYTNELLRNNARSYLAKIAEQKLRVLQQMVLSSGAASGEKAEKKAKP